MKTLFFAAVLSLSSVTFASETAVNPKAVWCTCYPDRSEPMVKLLRNVKEDNSQVITTEELGYFYVPHMWESCMAAMEGDYRCIM